MEIYQMDYHYHAGQERNNKSLRQHLEHAVITGRRIVGITDHYHFYIPNNYNNLSDKPIYEHSFKGLKDYYNELEDLKSEFQILTLYFSPEISYRTSYIEVPDEVTAISDYYICELPAADGDIKENTERTIDRLDKIAEFSKKTKRSVFSAHPFRTAVNLRIESLINNTIDPDIANIPIRENFYKYSAEEVSNFFMIDVVQLGRESAKRGIPLEINGETHHRIRMTNLFVPLQLLWAAYAIMKEQGAYFVPGSDQHDFKTGRSGAYVPYDCFHAIGVKATDINFII